MYDEYSSASREPGALEINKPVVLDCFKAACLVASWARSFHRDPACEQPEAVDDDELEADLRQWSILEMLGRSDITGYGQLEDPEHLVAVMAGLSLGLVLSSDKTENTRNLSHPEIRSALSSRFEDLRPSRRKEILADLNSLKTPGALKRNVEKVMSMLRGNSNRDGQMNRETGGAEVVVVPHDPNWQQLYIGEAIRLSSALGELLASVHHVGSTAVPAMCARPIIDILVEVRDVGAVDSYSPAMKGYGYFPSGEAGGEDRRLFYRENEEGAITHYVHVVQEGDPEVRRQVLVRDYLVGHPEDAEAYCGLKEDLAGRFPRDPESYDRGKQEFLERLLERLEA